MYGLYYDLEYKLSVHVLQELYIVSLARGGFMNGKNSKAERFRVTFLLVRT